MTSTLQTRSTIQPFQSTDLTVEPSSPSTTSRWRSLFSLFDLNESGFISTIDLGSCLRAAGFPLTEQVLNHIINTACGQITSELAQTKQAGETEGKSQSTQAQSASQLDFATFYSIAQHLSVLYADTPPFTVDTLRSDFQVFDTYKGGLLSIEDFTTLFRTVGEPLNHEDVTLLLNEIEIDGDGKINIEQFIQHMFKTSRGDEEKG